MSLLLSKDKYPPRAKEITPSASNCSQNNSVHHCLTIIILIIVIINVIMVLKSGMGISPSLQTRLGSLRGDRPGFCRAHPPGHHHHQHHHHHRRHHHCPHHHSHNHYHCCCRYPQCLRILIYLTITIIPQRLLKLDLAWDIDTTRTRVSTLVTLAYSHPSLAALPPSLLASSAILTALRPALETGGAMLGAPRDTPSPSFGLEVVWPLAPLGLVSSSEISGLGGREAAITSSSCSIAPTTWKWWQMLLLLWMLKLAGTSLF